MKSALRTIALAALVSVAFVAPALRAQDRPIARVNVPFSFETMRAQVSTSSRLRGGGLRPTAAAESSSINMAIATSLNKS
jgi:hypothetical protein